jgi:hypothetical protein
MKVYSRNLAGSYPSTPTTWGMNAMAAHAVSNLSEQSRTDYVASFRGLGEGEPVSSGTVTAAAVGTGIGLLAFSVALWGFAGYGVYKFATRK